MRGNITFVSILQEMVVAASQPRSSSNSPTTAVVSVAQIQAARIATGSLVTATSIPGTIKGLFSFIINLM